VLTASRSCKFLHCIGRQERLGLVRRLHAREVGTRFLDDRSEARIASLCRRCEGALEMVLLLASLRLPPSEFGFGHFHPAHRGARLDRLECIVAALGRRGDLAGELGRGRRRLQKTHTHIK